ncbi:hypothetical protein GCM10009654_45560 [Streptomyces hebeiensis]|uniref:Uncharacterized protein n=1 Tax=Streptomyces hebeiensis TaxID=229486 RepID=A0ABN1UZR6_9ACTN
MRLGAEPPPVLRRGDAGLPAHQRPQVGGGAENVLGRYSFTPSTPRQGLRPLRDPDALELDDDEEDGDEWTAPEARSAPAPSHRGQGVSAMKASPVPAVGDGGVPVRRRISGR